MKKHTDPDAHLRSKQRQLRKAKTPQIYILVDEREAAQLATGDVPTSVIRQLARAMTLGALAGPRR